MFLHYKKVGVTMAYNVTQEDLNILKQGSQETYIKVELCDPNYKILDSLEGIVLSDSLNVDSESIQRRSYSCDLAIIDSTFIIGKDKKIWADKRLRIYYGIKSIRTKKMQWYRIGTFVYLDMNYSYTQSERRLSLSCADLMAEYDGTLNGQVGGYGSSNDSEHVAQGLMIPAGEDIRESIIATLKDARITNYIVEDIEKEIPYDLEFDTGVTYAEVWQEVCELYDSWEFFFDIDGTFIWRKIPTCYEDPVILTDEVMQDIVISESTSASFTGIYNVTEVWGKVLELTNEDRYTEESTYENNIYNVNFSEYSSWEDIDNLTKISFKILTTNIDNPMFSVNNYSSIPIVDGDGNPLKAGALESDSIYVFRYRRITVDEEQNIEAKLYLLGQFQCYGKYVETSESCPFSVSNLGYEILNSVEYDGLSDDAACYNQAEYLTYKSTAMMDTINLTTLVIPWIDVNMKVEYTPLYNNVKNQYIIKNFSWSIGDGTMSITLYKFLEDFSFVWKDKQEILSRTKN